MHLKEVKDEGRNGSIVDGIRLKMDKGVQVNFGNKSQRLLSLSGLLCDLSTGFGDS